MTGKTLGREWMNKTEPIGWAREVEYGRNERGDTYLDLRREDRA